MHSRAPGVKKSNSHKLRRFWATMWIRPWDQRCVKSLQGSALPSFHALLVWGSYPHCNPEEMVGAKQLIWSERTKDKPVSVRNFTTTSGRAENLIAVRWLSAIKDNSLGCVRVERGDGGNGNGNGIGEERRKRSRLLSLIGNRDGNTEAAQVLTMVLTLEKRSLILRVSTFWTG